MQELFYETVAVLAVINPVVCGIMVLQFEEGKSISSQVSLAFQSMFLVLLIFILVAIQGNFFLQQSGIPLEALKVVGGLVLLGIGIRMIIGFSKKSNVKSKRKGLVSLVLFAASPGSVALVISLAAINSKNGFPTSTLYGIVSAIVITLIIISSMIFVNSKRGSQRQKGNGLFSKIIAGFIILMGLQFIHEGVVPFL